MQGRKEGRGGGASTICFVEEPRRFVYLRRELSVDFREQELSKKAKWAEEGTIIMSMLMYISTTQEKHRINKSPPIKNPARTR